MLNVECATCGTTFGAQRKTAKFCSTKCRVAAQRDRDRNGGQVQKIEPRRDGARLVALEPRHESEEGLIAVTRRTLEQANRLTTYRGVAAMTAARLLDSGVQDTMSSMAAMLKEYDRLMVAALEGATTAESPLVRARREREARVG